MQREGSSVGAIVQQPFDSLLVFFGTFVFQVRTAGQDVVDLGRDTNMWTLSMAASTTLSSEFPREVFMSQSQIR